MTLSLAADRDAMLARTGELITKAWRSFDQSRPDQPPIDDRLRELLREAMPKHGMPIEQALDDAALVLDESIAQPRPRYFAFVGSSGLEIGVVADALAACFDVNLAAYAAAATDVEEQAVRWVGEFLGFPAGGGTFTSGGTVSNLTALAAARERALPGAREHGLNGHRLALYCSAEAHYSVVRAAELLGIGSGAVRRIACDQERRVRPDQIAEAIDRDRAAGVTPLAVVATAGTTLTGAVDPIGSIAEVCEPRNVWLHVDGAYGLPAAATASARSLFRGLERADSLALDAHKWLYLPKACGVVLVRKRDDLRAAFSHRESYMPHDRGSENAVDTTLEYSRPFRALKLWLAFRVHGADAFRQAVEGNLALARLLQGAVEDEPELEPALRAPQLSTVPFRHVPRGVDDLDAHNAELAAALQRDGRVWVAPATIDGCVYLRPCIVNFRTSAEDVLALVEIALEVGRELAAP